MQEGNRGGGDGSGAAQGAPRLSAGRRAEPAEAVGAVCRGDYRSTGRPLSRGFVPPPAGALARARLQHARSICHGGSARSVHSGRMLRQARRRQGVGDHENKDGTELVGTFAATAPAGRTATGVSVGARDAAGRTPWQVIARGLGAAPFSEHQEAKLRVPRADVRTSCVRGVAAHRRINLKQRSDETETETTNKNERREDGGRNKQSRAQQGFQPAGRRCRQ